MSSKKSLASFQNHIWNLVSLQLSLTKPCVLSFTFSHGWCCMSPNKLARAHCWTGPGCLWRVSHSSAWRCLNVRVTGPWKGGRPLSPPDLSTMPCTMTSTKSTMMLPRLEVCGLTVGPRRVYSPSVSQDIWHQPAATTCTKIAALTLYRLSKCPRHGLLPVEVEAPLTSWSAVTLPFTLNTGPAYF